MIAFPAGVKVWIAGGVTDMRCGVNSLALKVQQGLGRDPHGGEVFSQNGSAVPVSAAQLGYLLEGIDWRNPRWTQRPSKAG